jgi:hypothetical protein
LEAMIAQPVQQREARQIGHDLPRNLGHLASGIRAPEETAQGGGEAGINFHDLGVQAQQPPAPCVQAMGKPFQHRFTKLAVSIVRT